MKYYGVMQGPDGIPRATAKLRRKVVAREVSAWAQSIGRAALVPSTRRTRGIIRGGSTTALEGLLTEFEVKP